MCIMKKKDAKSNASLLQFPLIIKNVRVSNDGATRRDRRLLTQQQKNKNDDDHLCEYDE